MNKQHMKSGQKWWKVFLEFLVVIAMWALSYSARGKVSQVQRIELKSKFLLFKDIREQVALWDWHVTSTDMTFIQTIM